MRRSQQNCIPAPAHNRHHNHNDCDNNRFTEEEDYTTFVTRLEKKTSMVEGPHFGNMQHMFKRVEVFEEVDDQESEASGRFGRSNHRGRNHNACEENAESKSTEYIRTKHDYLFKA